MNSYSPDREYALEVFKYITSRKTFTNMRLR